MHPSEPMIYCCKSWHEHTEICTSANSPLAQAAQQILLSSRKSLLCYIKSPSLFPTHKSGRPEGEQGIAVHQSRVCVCWGWAHPAFWGSREAQVDLSLAYMLMQYKICVFKCLVLTLKVKNFFLVSNLNLPSCQSEAVLLVLSLHDLKSLFSIPLGTLWQTS